ncbi:hypothetical protein PoB_002068200 [Plakobranchus ocellatus]|uniref:Uncharacterized protein n=1 Tax=Plakobranchus ocellatus TaxID=259542 RepID=A0AAV3ZI15_9GAST|nr:hypothetical protein PoB_002068200 [Plakobranchus ocellatus]
MKNTMDLCDERKLPFHGKKHAQKKPVRSYTPTDEQREVPPKSQYDKDRRHRQYYAELLEDQYRRRFRDYRRSGQIHNRNSARR